MYSGFEKSERGLSEKYTEKVSPLDRHFAHMENLGHQLGSVTPGVNEVTSNIIRLFAYAATEYMEKYPDCQFEDFVKIAHKNRQQGLQNPRASHNRAATAESLGDKRKMLCYPITSGMCANTADGGAAAIICSEQFVNKMNMRKKAVEVLTQHMVTDLPSSFGKSLRDLSGYSLAREAARRCYSDTGFTPQDVDVIEVHDCFAPNELFMYEALGLAEEGTGTQLLRGGKWISNHNGGQVYQMGNKWVVNPSGGLESKGHPIGATGKIVLLCWLAVLTINRAYVFAIFFPYDQQLLVAKEFPLCICIRAIGR